MTTTTKSQWLSWLTFTIATALWLLTAWRIPVDRALFMHVAGDCGILITSFTIRMLNVPTFVPVGLAAIAIITGLAAQLRLNSTSRKVAIHLGLTLGSLTLVLLYQKAYYVTLMNNLINILESRRIAGL